MGVRLELLHFHGVVRRFLAVLEVMSSSRMVALERQVASSIVVSESDG